MSGIAGIYYLDGRPIERAEIERMTSILAHRGPDGAGVWSEGSVGLGHRMLWTTPESLGERLPLVHPSGRLVLTADARIDNRDELIHALGLEDRPGEEIADSELILRAYEEWGERCTEKLLGDFVFALWDGYRQVLFCARDHFGMKPFYYCFMPGTAFAFASEIKALTCLPWVPRQLNETRVADYLESLVEDQAITFYRKIMRLPPARSMTVDLGGLSFSEYWSLDPTREIHYRTDEEYAEAFREIFVEAVRCRLRSSFPLGFALSGGLDSSSIVSVAQRLTLESQGSVLHTFSCIFDEVSECDERSYIQAILANGRVEPHYVHLDQLGALEDMDAVLWHQDQPIYIRNMFLWTSMYRLAHQEGVRTMLDGEDGDTVVSHGDGYLVELARSGQWEEFARLAAALSQHAQSYNVSPVFWLQVYGLPYLTELAREGRWVAFGRAMAEVHRHFDIPRRRLFWEQGLRPVAPEPARWVWRALRGRAKPKKESNFLISPGLAQRVGFRRRVKDLMARYGPIRTLREGHWLGLTGGITSCIHEEDNKAAAAFGIEKRHPFWDRRLVEFCLAVPAQQKLHEGWPRWILRRAMAGILPAEIRWRVGKSNLNPNFKRGLLDLERVRLEKLIFDDPKSIEQYVNIPTLQDAYHRRNANVIWPAMILELWLGQADLAP